MHARQISVVIPTRNRAELLSRAVTSAQRAGISRDCVVIVDDCSSPEMAELVRQQFSDCQLVLLASQNGPCMALNAGLERVKTKFAILLDDEDALTSNAVDTINQCLNTVPHAGRYPVLQFACTNALAAKQYFVATLADYVNGAMRGRFAPVIQMDVFRAMGLRYPTGDVGGETRLCFKVAKATGMPTWNRRILDLHTDAPMRFSSVDSQLRRPRDYATDAEELLAEFGGDLQLLSRAYYRKKRAGAAFYRLLAGDRSAALHHAQQLLQQGSPLMSAGVLACSAFPQRLFRNLFAAYRRHDFA